MLNLFTFFGVLLVVVLLFYIINEQCRHESACDNCYLRHQKQETDSKANSLEWDCAVLKSKNATLEAVNKKLEAENNKLTEELKSIYKSVTQASPPVQTRIVPVEKICDNCAHGCLKWKLCINKKGKKNMDPKYHCFLADSDMADNTPCDKFEPKKGYLQNPVQQPYTHGIWGMGSIEPGMNCSNK